MNGHLSKDLSRPHPCHLIGTDTASRDRAPLQSNFQGVGGTSLPAVPAWLCEGEERARFGRAELLCSHCVAVHPASWSPASSLSYCKSCSWEEVTAWEHLQQPKNASSRASPWLLAHIPCHALAPGRSACHPKPGS